MRRLLDIGIIAALALVGALVVGCSFKYQPTGASSEVEGVLLKETARSAGALSVNVHGEITETISKGQQAPGQNDPVGWYQAGVAWYYRPQVARYVSLEPEAGHETARNVAGHEVCHAVSFFHDLKHWECMNGVAAPTYPRPSAGGTWTGAAFASVPAINEAAPELIE